MVITILGLICLLSLSPATLAAGNDYPTEARVDYVLGCMAANGQNYLTMQKCSCSIDVIAELVPYEDYEAVTTILSMQDQRGEMGMLFRTERGMQEDVERFRGAQTEADLRCF
ncbi:hypothetical protein L861_20685 [Litchfieldella anticariensis FP35 = DSM 16096]|uniref:Uncharacterized protein n=1 Tax=Litchfieldella anticariensis (strain DSM 16096 / CECT 5854 / CIP 108499 / LMG 22089 / FP35) TaxID=1121939 RepID=S2KNM2_LITA3|nr:hypothetical protein [Halomonas anticariensis]EPC02073.1 hypothetical protein L861_20685 [Halomonas anticariensis FP35 = DSM 16096]